MEPLKHPQVTRVFTDNPEEGPYYDQGDVPEMFDYAQEGEMWTPYWGCGRNRTLQVGNVVFFLCLGEGDLGYGLFARGSVIAGDPDEQLRLRDSKTYGDLSAAYCRNDSDSFGQQEDMFSVRYLLDSIVELWHPLPIRWLQQQPSYQDLFQEVPSSGDLIPAHLVASLNEYWEDHVRKMAAQGLGVRFSQR